jgi:hypothetical protein
MRAREADAVRQRAGQVGERLRCVMGSEGVCQARPAGREGGSVKVPCQVAALLDVIAVRSAIRARAAAKHDRRIRLIVTWRLRLAPLLGSGRPVRVQLAAERLFQRVVMAWPVCSPLSLMPKSPSVCECLADDLEGPAGDAIAAPAGLYRLYLGVIDAEGLGQAGDIENALNLPRWRGQSQDAWAGLHPVPDSDQDAQAGHAQPVVL